MGQAYEANDPMVETVPAKIPATHTIVSETPVRVAPIVHTAPVVQHVPEVAEISNTVVRSVASVPIKKKRVKKPKKERMGPKRPPSSFILYSMEMRPKLREERPDLKTVGERSTVLASRWKELAADKKQKYLDMAKKRKEKYLQEMEVFKKGLAENAEKAQMAKQAREHAEQEAAILQMQHQQHQQVQALSNGNEEEIAVPVPTSHVSVVIGDHAVPVPTVHHTAVHSVPTIANI